MPIPDLDAHGLLPVGVYDCTLEELRDRFGAFQTSDQRCRLFERLEQFMREAKLSGIAQYVIVDGSFVTGKAVPNDIDLIVVVPEGHTISTRSSGRWRIIQCRADRFGEGTGSMRL